jgi:hypothetical protein
MGQYNEAVSDLEKALELTQGMYVMMKNKQAKRIMHTRGWGVVFGMNGVVVSGKGVVAGAAVVVVVLRAAVVGIGVVVLAAVVVIGAVAWKIQWKSAKARQIMNT